MKELHNFEIFWEAYPKKRNKPDARKAWNQLSLEKNDGVVDKIIRAIAEFRGHKDWQREGGQFIPYPASFLRGERWEDVMDVDIEEGGGMRW